VYVPTDWKCIKNPFEKSGLSRKSSSVDKQNERNAIANNRIDHKRRIHGGFELERYRAGESR